MKRQQKWKKKRIRSCQNHKPPRRKKCWLWLWARSSSGREMVRVGELWHKMLSRSNYSNLIIRHTQGESSVYQLKNTPTWKVEKERERVDKLEINVFRSQWGREGKLMTEQIFVVLSHSFSLPFSFQKHLFFGGCCSQIEDSCNSCEQQQQWQRRQRRPSNNLVEGTISFSIIISFSSQSVTVCDWPSSFRS